MTRSFDVAGLTLTIGSIVAAVAVAQWLVMLIAAAVSKEKLPQKGLRSADLRMIISSAVFAVGWIGVFAGTSTAAKTNAAAVVSGKSHGSCSQISTDMASSVVKKKLGDPDEVRSEEDTRGPGAAIWVYRDSRCAVHIFDNKVEFID
ncbi:MAG TPA: hypothetical protein VLV78_09790 [Thermoanaerobaculia bacterium]|nr:hypothetical protein [Thermoanaerobaculia bacterium]